MKSRTYFFAKRLFDIIAAFVGIVGTSPIWLFAVIGIELSDPGTLFYKAERIGKDNAMFYMWKFRSMRKAKTIAEQSEASFKADTNRIFPFGNLIRKLKIDELPQLINIIIGDMSVVGPRPVAKDQMDVFRVGTYNEAALVRPGLTGPAALYDYIYGDSVEDSRDYEKLVLPKRLELEVFYTRNMSWFYDIKMIWYTLICIFCSLFGKKNKTIYDELVSCSIDYETAPERMS